VDLFISPFVDYGFMRRALAGCLALSLGCGPIGTFLVLRRMSLVGYALSHAVMPGAALGFIVGGLSLLALAIGGLVAGLAVALLAGLVSRLTSQGEDASFTVLYNTAIAVGVVLITAFAPSANLMGLLFGDILAIDDVSMLLIAGTATVTLIVLALIYRPLVVECFDPQYLRAIRGRGGLVQAIFLALTVLNLVSAFQGLGVLMAVGLLILPAVSARFWASDVAALCAVSTGIGLGSGYAGMVASFAFDQPSGPTIVLVAGLVYGVSVLFGRRNGLLVRRSERLTVSAVPRS
jgi:zinc/manganese transport system permease protein